MTYLLFTVALALSAVAAWYAIAGLIAIFAAAVIPIAIMGSLLEASKLVVASWLYRSWNDIPLLMKSYFTVALVTLMLLTSMGIFGFLSKAHLDQALPTGEAVSKLEMIDEKIKTQRENLDASRQAIAQLDKQVNETINRTASQDNNAGVNRSIQIRRSQQAERRTLLAEIGTAQAEIAKLQEERAPLASEVRKVEAEIGPIKYIAELIYGEEAKDSTIIEKAVRFVILIIVFVFDPLAVLMLVAANWQMRKDKEGTALVPVSEVQVKAETVAEPEPQDVHVDEPPKPLPEEAKPILHKFFSKVKVEDKIKVEPQIEPKTIVEEVDSLQNKKGVDYDSLGRRITP